MISQLKFIIRFLPVLHDRRFPNSNFTFSISYKIDSGTGSRPKPWRGCVEFVRRNPNDEPRMFIVNVIRVKADFYRAFADESISGINDVGIVRNNIFDFEEQDHPGHEYYDH